MRLTNLNPDTDIGASCWVLEVDGHRLMLDAGTHPKREGTDALPLFDKVDDLDIDAIALTHCHHDHVGGLPVAMRRHPHARVLMTELSYFLVERVLHNSVNVMERQRAEKGIASYPLFTHQEVDELASVFQGFKYRRELDWTAPYVRRHKPGPTIEFLDAGHSLGSASVLVRGSKQTLLYTSDICLHDQTILRAADLTDARADVLILETTRGARETPPGWSREKELERLTQSILEILKGKGCVLIPAFALGRTQEILAHLAILMESGRLKRQPVYIGGLGRVFTEIYDLEAHRTSRQLTQLHLTEALDLQVLDVRKARNLKLNTPKIFVLTAGMMSENTAAHDLAARMAPEDRHGIFFVGYADPDTPGGRLKTAKPGLPFAFSPSAGKITRNCHMEDYDLTAHANREDLLNLITAVDPKTIVLTHGDGPARAWFAQSIASRYPRIRVLEAGSGQEIDV